MHTIFFGFVVTQWISIAEVVMFNSGLSVLPYPNFVEITFSTSQDLQNFVS